MRDYNSNCSVAKTSLYIYIALCLVGMAGVVHANHCKHGFVWRAASPSDLVCVTPQQRDQAAWDNEDAASRIAPCRSGFVFRNAAPGDKVCVTPAARDLASMDKRTVDARTECVLRKTFRCRFVPGHIDEHGNIVEHPKFHKNCQCLNIPPSTCSPGYVHRLATPTDLKCVLPEAHSRIAQENADAPKNKGVHDCISGYVWRNAFPGDLVCVTPGVHAQVQADNRAANSRLVSHAACEAYASSAVAQAEEYFSRGCRRPNDRDRDRWQTNYQNHLNFCLDTNGRHSQRETEAREGPLSQCRTTNPLGGAGHGANQGACNVSATVRNEECLNANGTPSSIIESGSLSAIGCGVDKNTALTAAKLSFASQAAIAEEPTAGACTYTSYFEQGCLCR